MKIHNMYDFIGGLLFLLFAVVGFYKGDPGIYVTFFALAVLFLLQGFRKKA